ncbi:MAG: LPS export ABC transporter periplasmic protein LptC [Alphaproteobacteria bacterium]|nr:LPS export ABC transporter periplasmic protein LptC [Alphaproteobacteria bacterium]MBV9371916.1 LPS export ABC transporter periplasmic protein LptC [Alphaproteobacteria bacterium]MBV9900439.1 LPS export ABC transporter periplasmic protein LptC [Alphaproteobacteria bacterium]
MADAAERDRVVKRSWAAPGGFHDILVRLLKVGLPIAVGGLLAYLLLSPLGKDKEASFLLDKKKVDTAHERMKMEAAQYRGLDNQGRPFTVDAARAVQATSTVPIVDIDGMAARIQLKDGPATVEAERARYHMDKQTADVVGPILVTGANGYRLETRNVNVDLNSHRLSGAGGVEGKMPLGSFTAGTMAVDLRNRQVNLGQRAHLHIVQGGLRGKRK